MCVLPICKGNWMGKGPVKWALTLKSHLVSWVVCEFLPGTSSLHHVQGFCRNGGLWFGTMSAPNLAGFLFGCEAPKTFFAPHWPTQKSYAPFWVGMWMQYVWGRWGKGRMKHLGCMQISRWYPAWLLWGSRNINADPHLWAVLQLQLDKDVNKQKCLLRQEEASGKVEG